MHCKEFIAKVSIAYASSSLVSKAQCELHDEVLKIDHKNLLPIWRRKVENNPIISVLMNLHGWIWGPRMGSLWGGGGQLAQILGRYVPRQNQKVDP